MKVEVEQAVLRRAIAQLREWAERRRYDPLMQTVVRETDETVASLELALDGESRT